MAMTVARPDRRVGRTIPSGRSPGGKGGDGNSGLKIGQLARRVGVTTKAIRFYEAKRVLPPATRGANGYRLYGQEALETLTFVTQAAGLGLTLAEIREVIAIRQGGAPPCAHVRRLLQDKARDLDRKLQDLIDMRRQIRRSLAAWKRAPRGPCAVCPHIEGHPVGVRRGG